MQTARRISELPPNVFAEANRRLASLRAEGVDTINLGIGDPDLPTPRHIVDALARAAEDPANHRYPNHFGLPELREAIAGWYGRRFGVRLDATREVLPLLGSKAGLVHAGLAFLDPGDVALVSEPCYPAYSVGAHLAGASVRWVPLTEGNAFVPDLDALSREVPERARVLWLNYPNNPTGAVASLEQLQRAVDFGRRHDLLVLHDAAYTEIAFDGYRPPSLLQASGALAVGVEFHSFSKTFNMPGWRLGMAVGNAEALEALAKLKAQTDTGIFPAVQRAGIAALEGSHAWMVERNEVYRRRRDLVCAALERLGMRAQAPPAGMFIWPAVPLGFSSKSFSLGLLDHSGVFIPPGTAFGPSGEGYVRISLTIDDARLSEAMERLSLFLSAG